MSWKSLALQVHRWLGLLAAVFLAVQALTGLAIVFRDELAALLQPAVFRVAPGPAADDFDQAVELARARHPDFELVRLDAPSRADRALVVRLARDEEWLVMVDARRGIVLADAPRTSFPVQWLYELHTHFLRGEAGRWMIALNGLALMLIGLSGPLVWWPGANRVGRALKPPRLRGPAFRLVANLHRFAGVYLCLLLLLMGATGLTLALMPEATKLVAGSLVTAKAPKLPKGGPAPARLTSIDDALGAARAEAPGLRLKSLRFSGPEGRLVRVVFQARGGHARRIDQVWIDRADGSVLDVQRADEAPAGTLLLSWMLPLHAGEAYGWAGRAVSVTAGTALLLFAISGAWLYLRRVWPRPRAR